MRIDLLPLEYRPQPLVNPKRLAVMIVGGVLLFSSLGLAGYEYLEMNATQINLDATIKELQIYDQSKAQLEHYDELKAKVQKYQNEIRQFQDAYQQHLPIFNGIANALTEQIWLDDIAFNMDGSVKVSGQSLDFALIGDFLERLNEMKNIVSCKLEKITETKDENIVTYSYEITLNTGRVTQYAQK